MKEDPDRNLSERPDKVFLLIDPKTGSHQGDQIVRFLIIWATFFPEILGKICEIFSLSLYISLIS